MPLDPTNQDPNMTTQDWSIYLNTENYATWSFLMQAKLAKIGALQVVVGPQPKTEEEKNAQKLNKQANTALGQKAYIELLEKMDETHLALTLALTKFISLEYTKSTLSFLSDIRAANQRLVAAKITLDAQVKTLLTLQKLPLLFISFCEVISVGCLQESFTSFLKRLENDAEKNKIKVIAKSAKPKPPATSTKGKPAALAHHTFTEEQIEAEYNFQQMITSLEFKKLQLNQHL
ncbi:hypothetical protein PCASD_05186 [Puccinia coronata f. sp. avenae]|uniref:DUF4219 domain-containing protein n=1 Tax=Puccinia coronata f. sp. avenae TaxID=200324 RepID=A0A2N5TH32_9BASI|nr:hypothetical protein PCASD_05186 [Puccinia coronata f. sp. avenae]